MAVGQNLVPLVNPKIAGKWMFIPLKMVLIGIDPYPHIYIYYVQLVVYQPIGPSNGFCSSSCHARFFGVSLS